MDFVFHFPEIPREALLRGPCRPGQPPHAAPASVSAHLLWQRVPALPACLWHCHSPLFGASSCCQVPGDATWSSGRLVQVPWWVKIGFDKISKSQKVFYLAYFINCYMCAQTALSRTCTTRSTTTSGIWETDQIWRESWCTPSCLHWR